MKCLGCGNSIPGGSKVCPYCGVLTVAAVGTQASEWNPAQGYRQPLGQPTAPRPATAPPRRRSAVLPAVLTLLVLALGAAGVLLYLNWDTVGDSVLALLPGAAVEEEEVEELTCYYASSAVVEASTQTVFVPCDADGNALEDFVVELSPADDDSGETWTARITPSGSEFTLAGVDRLEEGSTYFMQVTSNVTGETYQCPPVLVVDTGSSDDSSDDASADMGDGETTDSVSDASGAAERVVLLVDPDDPESATAPVYYSTQVDHQVSLTILSSSTSEETYSSNLTWTYPVFSCSEQSEGVETLNALLYEAYAEVLALVEDDDAIAEALDEGEVCVLYRATVTCIEDGIAGVRYEQVTTDGQTETSVVWGALYDLGEGTKVSAESVTGLTNAELRAEATAAVEAFIGSSSIEEWDEDAVEKAVASSSSYYLADEGLVLVVAAGVLDDDAHELVVVPSGAFVTLGYDVAGTYY